MGKEPKTVDLEPGEWAVRHGDEKYEESFVPFEQPKPTGFKKHLAIVVGLIVSFLYILCDQEIHRGPTGTSPGFGYMGASPNEIWQQEQKKKAWLHWIWLD